MARARKFSVEAVEKGAPMGGALSRRDWCIGVGALVGCLALGGAGKALASGESCVRPPGGQDEDRLRALCLKCDRCRSVCPPKIITYTSSGDSLFEVRVPRLDFHVGYCDFCGRCQQVCLTQALAPSFDPSCEALGVAQLNTALCLAYSTACEKCRDVCPYGALVFSQQNHPTIDAQVCNGCGRCVDVCQSNIAGTFSGHDRALEVRVAKVGQA